MRHYRIILGCIAAIALLAVAFTGGCAKQPQETAPPDLTPPQGTTPEEAAPNTTEEPSSDTTGAEPSGAAAQTMADLIKKWPSSFAMTATAKNKETGRTDSATFAFKMQDHKPAKMKMTLPQGGMLVDYTDKVTYTWDNQSNTAMKMPMVESDQGSENPYENVDPNMKITGSETIDGVDCWVIEQPTGDGGTSTIWVAKDTGLTQQTETGNMVINYKYDQIGSVPGSEFEVPSGMEIKELSQAMPQGMPQMPQGTPPGTTEE
jgi:hypothetical protein